MTTQGARNRDRGARGERAVVAYLRQNGWPDARRYLAADGRAPGDIDAIPGVAIEVKDRAVACWPEWIRQAKAEAGPDRMWAVVRRTRGTPDVAQWPTIVDAQAWADTTVGATIDWYTSMTSRGDLGADIACVQGRTFVDFHQLGVVGMRFGDLIAGLRYEAAQP